MFDSTVTMGSTSAGNSTFLIRLPPEIRTLDDSSSDEENQVQGRRPQNRNSGYGCDAVGRVLQHEREDERVDEQQQQRVDERPEEAEHRPAVARLELARDEALDERAVAKQLREVVKHGITDGYRLLARLVPKPGAQGQGRRPISLQR